LTVEHDGNEFVAEADVSQEVFERAAKEPDGVAELIAREFLAASTKAIDEALLGPKFGTYTEPKSYTKFEKESTFGTRPDPFTQTMLRGEGSVTAEQMREVVRSAYKAEEKDMPCSPVSTPECPACGCEVSEVTFMPFDSVVRVRCAGCGGGIIFVRWAECDGTGAFVRVQREGKWQNVDIADCTNDEVEKLMAGRSKDEVVRWLVVALRAVKGVP
jgi:hypothetical protein